MESSFNMKKIKSMQVKVWQILELLRIIKSYADVDRNWKLVKESTGWSDRTFYHVAQACQNLHLIRSQAHESEQHTTVDSSLAR